MPSKIRDKFNKTIVFTEMITNHVQQLKDRDVWFFGVIHAENSFLSHKKRYIVLVSYKLYAPHNDKYKA